MSCDNFHVCVFGRFEESLPARPESWVVYCHFKMKLTADNCNCVSISNNRQKLPLLLALLIYISDIECFHC